jgi:hypothetical protein
MSRHPLEDALEKWAASKGGPPSPARPTTVDGFHADAARRRQKQINEMPENVRRKLKESHDTRHGGGAHGSYPEGCPWCVSAPWPRRVDFPDDRWGGELYAKASQLYRELFLNDFDDE